MRLGIGLGLFKQAAVSVGVRLFSAYKSRVIADGGTVEADNCAINALNNGLLQSASLLLIPSGYKGGKLYSEIPTNGNGDLTWTRGSDAFRTNASGVLQRVPWNLVQYSEQFDNAVWTKSATTLSANTTVAPNGTTTADTLIENTANSSHQIFQSITNVNGATPYTAMIYVKENANRNVAIRIQDGAFTYGQVVVTYNLNTGALISQVATGNGVVVSTSATLTNGYYLIAVSFSINLSTSFRYDVLMVNGTSNSYTGDGTSSIVIWGAQLVEGTTAQTYLPTTDRLNFPRLSYMYGSCPSALLEPQRTNLVLQSESFDSASWVKTNVTITANTTTSPDGSTNADKIIATTTNDLHICESSTNSFVNGTTYTFSFYAKKSENDFIQFTASSSLLSTRANFNVSNGTLGTVDAGLTASITSANDGWYRCIVTFTASATGSFRIILCAITTSTAVRFQTFAGNGTSGLFLYGAQLEAGAYPTTYIPTTSATATRVADSAVKMGISSLIGQTEGTVYLQANLQKYSETGFVVAIGDGTLANSIYLQRTATNGLDLYCRKSGNTDVVLSVLSANWTAGNNKIAIAYGSTSFEIYINGVSQGSASFVGLPSMSQYTVGSRPDNLGTLVATGHYQQMALFTTRLSASNLTTLTTL